MSEVSRRDVIQQVYGSSLSTRALGDRSETSTYLPKTSGDAGSVHILDGKKSDDVMTGESVGLLLPGEPSLGEQRVASPEFEVFSEWVMESLRLRQEYL